jgi:hypothetical protein
MQERQPKTRMGGKEGKKRTEKNQHRAEQRNQPRVPTLPHDRKDDRRNRTPKERRKRPQSNVRNLVVNVRLADVFELEVAVVADEPALEGEKELGAVGGGR